jgi:hypothetical protein
METNDEISGNNSGKKEWARMGWRKVAKKTGLREDISKERENDEKRKEKRNLKNFVIYMLNLSGPLIQRVGEVRLMASSDDQPIPNTPTIRHVIRHYGIAGWQQTNEYLTL